MTSNSGYVGPLPRPSPEQKLYLANYMYKHKALAQNEFLGHQGKHNIRELWKELTKKLNSFKGGAIKPMDKWMKYWSDQKKMVRDRASEINFKLRESGRNGELLAHLSPYELRVLDCQGGVNRIVGYPEIVDPLEDEEADPFLIPQEMRRLKKDKRVKKQQSAELKKPKLETTAESIIISDDEDEVSVFEDEQVDPFQIPQENRRPKKDKRGKKQQSAELKKPKLETSAESIIISDDEDEIFTVADDELSPNFQNCQVSSETDNDMESIDNWEISSGVEETSNHNNSSETSVPLQSALSSTAKNAGNVLVRVSGNQIQTIRSIKPLNQRPNLAAKNAVDKQPTQLTSCSLQNAVYSTAKSAGNVMVRVAGNQIQTIRSIKPLNPRPNLVSKQPIQIVKINSPQKTVFSCTAKSAGNLLVSGNQTQTFEVSKQPTQFVNSPQKTVFSSAPKSAATKLILASNQTQTSGVIRPTPQRLNCAPNILVSNKPIKFIPSQKTALPSIVKGVSTAMVVSNNQTHTSSVLRPTLEGPNCPPNIRVSKPIQFNPSQKTALSSIVKGVGTAMVVSNNQTHTSSVLRPTLERPNCPPNIRVSKPIQFNPSQEPLLSFIAKGASNARVVSHTQTLISNVVGSSKRPNILRKKT